MPASTAGTGDVTSARRGTRARTRATSSTCSPRTSWPGPSSPWGSSGRRPSGTWREAAGLGNARKPDSQDICFVPDGDYARVIEHQTGKAAEPGDFVSPEGTVLGRHQGLIRYTVGQHRGLGLSLPERRYVCRLCPESNTVVLGPEEALYRREALAGDFHWIAGEPPAGPIRCRVKLRYRQRERDAEAFPWMAAPSASALMSPSGP